MHPTLLLAYMGAIAPELQVSHHLDATAALFDRAGRSQVRALVSVPPGHGVSTLFRLGIARHLVEHPKAVVALVTPRMSTSQAAKKQILAWAPSAADHIVGLAPGSAMIALIPDLIVIDGLFATTAEAASPQVRHRVHMWLEHLLFVRARPDASVIWGPRCLRDNDDEMLERLVLDEATRPWEVVVHPAISAAGAPLWPQHHPLDQLLETKSAVGPRVWDIAYQGEPLRRALASLGGESRGTRR